MTASSPSTERLSDALLSTGVTFVTGVPDSAFTALISELEEAHLDRAYLLATREDNAVALAVGAHLAGERPLVFMESSGIGNAIDALTSLVSVFEIPLVLLIAWAGYEGRDVPHHNAIGEPLHGVVEALGIPSRVAPLADRGALVAAVAEALEQAEARSGPVAVLGVPPELAEAEGGAS